MLLDELLADDEEEIVDYEDDASRDAPPADERTDRKRARSDSRGDETGGGGGRGPSPCST